MADWGFKVSLPGYNVLTCTDDQLMMSSKFNTFKVSAVGSTSSTYAHGLAYKPAFFASELLASGKYGIVGQHRMTICKSGSTNFDAQGVTCKYYLFHQQGNQ